MEDWEKGEGIVGGAAGKEADAEGEKAGEEEDKEKTDDAEAARWGEGIERDGRGLTADIEGKEVEAEDDDDEGEHIETETEAAKEAGRQEIGEVEGMRGTAPKGSDILSAVAVDGRLEDLDPVRFGPALAAALFASNSFLFFASCQNRNNRCMRTAARN